MRRLSVLLIAESADHNLVSVPLVAWSIYIALNKLHNVHIVTQVRHRLSFIEYGLKEFEDFTAIDSEFVAKPVYHLTKFFRGGESKAWTLDTAMKYPGQLYFEHLIWKNFKYRLINREFDIVHRISPVSPTIPSPISIKCKRYKIPFVWGPIAGGLPWPNEFSSEKNKEKEWLTNFREFYKLLPYYRSSRENSNALIVNSRATLDQIDKKYHSKTIYIPENAIDPSRFDLTNQVVVKKPYKVVFIGRLVPYKCADVAILGLIKHLLSGDASFHIFGDGPEMTYLKNIASVNKVQSSVTFYGNVLHTELNEQIKDADILLFPSIREFGGGVVLEAMALGIMPIVVNYGGPSELVTEDTGILLELGNKETLVSQIDEVFNELLEKPESIHMKGINSQRRVSSFYTWDKKAKMITDVYEWVLGNNEKPNFKIPLVDP